MTDSDRLTIDTVKRVMNEDWGGIQFFRQICGYFNFDTHEDFWPRVAFFNFLPESVGGGPGRFRSGSQRQIEAGRARFLDLLRELTPDKTFVFTSKQWAVLGAERYDDIACKLPLYPPKFRAVSCAGCSVFFLRHPQGARKAEMTDAVQTLL